VYVSGANQTSLPAGLTATIAVQGSAGGTINVNGVAIDPNLFYEVKVVCTDGTMVSTSVQAD
jgi:hypothetical protein